MEQNTKLLGGIGYIAMIVFSIISAFVPFTGILTLIAAICVLVAFIQAGNQLGRPDVKQNIIIAIATYIVAMILLVFLFGAGLAASMAKHGSGIGALGTGIIIGGIVGWLLSIVAAWFWYKASAALTEATNVNLFKVGGLLLFIGAILLIVFGIGGIVMLIGEIVQAIAFFTVEEKRPVASKETV